MTRHVLIALSLLLVLFPLTVGKPGLPPTLKADEPAYYLMALSLWRDGDLRCDTGDLHRLFDEYPYTARNLILMSDDGWNSVYFGKPYIYSLAAAPMAGLFGANGMVAFNMALLMGMIWLGTFYLRRFNPDPLAALYSSGFFLLSSGFAYVFWLHPEIFTMAAVTASLYLGLTDGSASESPPGRIGRLLSRPAVRAALSAAALSLAIYRSPALGALCLPVLFAYTRLQKGWKWILVWVLAAGVALGAMAGLATVLTGHPSAYLGVARAGVNVHDPSRMPVQPIVVPEGVTPSKQNSWDWIFRKPDPDLPLLAENLGYFMWGRHAGLLPYMPFAVLALLLFLINGRRSGARWMLVLSLTIVALFFLTRIYFNWHGGGGFVGNRYYVNVYPAFLFLVTRIRPAWFTALGYALGGLLVGPVLFTPFGAPVPHPTLQAHARNYPFRLFPLEMSLEGRIPGYRGTGNKDVWFLGRKDQFKAVGDEMWLKGASTVELWIKSRQPLGSVLFRVRSPAADNRVEFWLEGAESSHDFGLSDAPGGERWETEMKPEGIWKLRSQRGVPMHIYRLRVRIRTGFDPHWTDPTASSHYLGAALTFLGSREEIDRDLYQLEWGACKVPEEVVAGEHFEVITRLTNRSQHQWPAAGPVRVNLSYHWLDPAGETLVWEGERSLLNTNLRAGGIAALTQRVLAPAEPGEYVLALEPVRENISWFSQRNPDAVLRVPVRVVADKEQPEEPGTRP